MSKDSYGDGNTYRGQRSRDSVVKTITLAQPEQIPPSAYSNTHQPENQDKIQGVDSSTERKAD